ncbi:MAG: polymer-forming cytoskeletal protein [Pseudomonadota bacterium]
MATLSNRLTSRVLFWTFIIIIFLFATSALLAQIESRSGEVLGVDDVFPDMAFFAAGDLTVNAKSTDDIFAAGGEISVDGAQADHMIIAGGEIIIADVAFRDLIAAGGDINIISGTITDDVVIAGGDLNIASDVKIDGSGMLTGGDVTIDAAIGGELRAAAASLHVNGNVNGDAHLTGEEVVLGPNITIGGDLRYRARKIEIAPSAVVTGEIIVLEPAPEPDFEKWSVKAASAIAVFALAFLLGAGVLVIAIALMLPSLMNSASEMISKKPFATLGIGVLIAIAAPAVIVFLFITVLGAPLALMTVALYVATAPVALAAFVYFLGMQGRRLLGKTAIGEPGVGARLIWSAIATAAFVIIALIPFLGGIVWVIGYLIGMGAVMTRGGRALALKA